MGTITMTTLLQVGFFVAVLINFTNGLSCSQSFWRKGCKANEYAKDCECVPRPKLGEDCHVGYAKCLPGLDCVPTGNVAYKKEDWIGRLSYKFYFSKDDDYSIFDEFEWVQVDHGTCEKPKKNKKGYHLIETFDE